MKSTLGTGPTIVQQPAGSRSKSNTAGKVLKPERWDHIGNTSKSHRADGTFSLCAPHGKNREERGQNHVQNFNRRNLKGQSEELESGR